MTTRDIDVRGKYTGLQTKPQYPAKALWTRNTAFWGPHSLLPVHTQDWASRRGAVALVSQRVRGYMMPRYEGQGKEVKWKEGPSLTKTTSSSQSQHQVED